MYWDWMMMMIMEDYKLFLNSWEGLGFVLNKKLESEKLEVEYLNSKDNSKEFEKYQIKSTPILIKLDKGKESGRLTSTDEIVEYLKNVSNIEI